MLPPARLARPAVAFILLLAPALGAQPPAAATASPPGIRDVDRTRLAEARRVASLVGDSVWSGWSTAPSATILVDGDWEYLLWHPAPGAGFRRLAHDSLLATDVHVRPRVFPRQFAATFPAVNGVQTVVIGTAEARRERSARWVLTWMHEHFHQWQYTRPTYRRQVDALDLARGDTTGMWMLEYAFPYDSARVVAAMDAWWTALRAGLGRQPRPADVTVEATTRALRDALASADYRYMAFQLWQEGIARYTEHAVAERAARAPQGQAFAALPDADPYTAAANEVLRETLAERAGAINEHRRVAFYPLGAALGLWLDGARPGWRREYVDRMFALDALVP